MFSITTRAVINQVSTAGQNPPASWYSASVHRPPSTGSRHLATGIAAKMISVSAVARTAGIINAAVPLAIQPPITTLLSEPSQHRLIKQRFDRHPAGSMCSYQIGRPDTVDERQRGNATRLSIVISAPESHPRTDFVLRLNPIIYIAPSR